MNTDFLMGLMVGAILVAVIASAWRQLDAFYDSQRHWRRRLPDDPSDG